MRCSERDAASGMPHARSLLAARADARRDNEWLWGVSTGRRDEAKRAPCGAALLRKHRYTAGRHARNGGFLIFLVLTMVSFMAWLV